LSAGFTFESVFLTAVPQVIRHIFALRAAAARGVRVPVYGRRHCGCSQQPGDRYWRCVSVDPSAPRT
jgi:hypothetical protein